MESEILRPIYEKLFISTFASMIAASIVISIFYPLECIESKMQIGIVQKSGIFSTLRKSNPAELYTGYFASVLGHILAWGTCIFITDLSKFLLADVVPETICLVMSCNF